MAGVAAGSVFTFLASFFVDQASASQLAGGAHFGGGDPATESFPLHTYHAVIQWLEQKKHQLSCRSCFNMPRLVNRTNTAARKLRALVKLWDALESSPKGTLDFMRKRLTISPRRCCSAYRLHQV